MNIKKVFVLVVNISVFAIQAMAVKTPQTLQTLASKATICAVLAAMENEQTWNKELTKISYLGGPLQELLIDELRNAKNDCLPWEPEHTLKWPLLKWITSANFSCDGQRIVINFWDATTKEFNASTFKPLSTPQGDMIIADDFSPDKKRLVTVSFDPPTAAKIWDASTFRLIYTIEGHTNPVLSAGFSPDGTQIITASRDKTAKIWNALTGEHIQTLHGHEHAVSSAHFSPNSQQIITVSWYGTIKLWSKGLRGSPEDDSPRTLFQLLLQAKLYSLKKQDGLLTPSCARLLHPIWQTLPEEHLQRLEKEYPILLFEND